MDCYLVPDIHPNMAVVYLIISNSFCFNLVLWSYVLSLGRKKGTTVYEMSLTQAVGPQLRFLCQPFHFHSHLRQKARNHTLQSRQNLSPASYPDVSLLMKMCAQRKAGRRSFPWSLAVHHQSLVSPSLLPSEKRSS